MPLLFIHTILSISLLIDAIQEAIQKNYIDAIINLLFISSLIIGAINFMKIKNPSKKMGI